MSLPRGCPCTLLRAAALLSLPANASHDLLGCQTLTNLRVLGSALPQLRYRAHAALLLYTTMVPPSSLRCFCSPAPCYPADYALSRFNESLSLVLLDASDYDAIYIADGHGLMWDGPYNSEIKRLVEEAWVGTSVMAHPGSCIRDVAGCTCLTALKAAPACSRTRR